MFIFTSGCCFWYSCAAASRVESTHTVNVPPVCATGVKPFCAPVLVPPLPPLPPHAATAASANAPAVASNTARLRRRPRLFLIAPAARTEPVIPTPLRCGDRFSPRRGRDQEKPGPD